METIMNIKNAETPLWSRQGTRALWRQISSGRDLPSSRSASTPVTSRVLDACQFHHLQFNCSECSLDEPSESPILPQHSKSPSGRKLPLASSDLENNTSVTMALENLELCENNCDNNNEVLHNNLETKKINMMEEKLPKGESSTSFQARDQLKKQMNKKNKLKTISPKDKSPKVYKAILRKNIHGPDGTKKVKLIKNKSPRNSKISSDKKISASNANSKKTDDSKKKLLEAHKSSIKKSPSLKKNQSSLKTSKCVRSPKLHTAARAMLRKYREDLRKEKEKEQEAHRIKVLEEQKRIEEQETIKIRQQTVFKAKPIRKYVPLPTIKKRDITDPISPNISKRRRVELSSQSTNSNQSK